MICVPALSVLIPDSFSSPTSLNCALQTPPSWEIALFKREFLALVHGCQQGTVFILLLFILGD